MEPAHRERLRGIRGASRRVAVFADVHESVHHLEAVLADIAKREIEDIWCLGDFIDGGEHSARVFDMVMSACTVVLLGNHELNLLNRSAAFELEPGTSSAFREVEITKQLGQLKPFRHEPALGVYMTHASLFGVWEGFAERSLDDGDEYLDRTLREAFEPITLVGHTHQALYAQLVEGHHVFEERPKAREVYRLSLPCVLNPGAVRDGNDARWLELRLAARPMATWHVAPVT